MNAFYRSLVYNVSLSRDLLPLSRYAEEFRPRNRRNFFFVNSTSCLSRCYHGPAFNNFNKVGLRPNGRQLFSSQILAVEAYVIC